MQDYKKTIDEEEKERITKDFLPFVKYTASRLSWRLPPQMTVDDLISAGLVGLLESLEKYEHGRAKLKTYVEYRIKGAMLDELRAADWVPRSWKKKAKDVRNAHSKLEKKLGRPPEDEEIAKELDLSLEEYFKILQSASSSITLRLEAFNWDSNAPDNLNLMESLPDHNAENPLHVLENKSRKEMVAKIIDELPEKERLLLSLYYWEELTMKEIAQVMKLTEGRICQLHNQALIRLKAKMESMS